MLDLTVDQALPLLENFPPIANKLRTLQDVGLGYIELGQSATTLSGGEAQRVKLARELSRRSTGRTLYILDEPTTGLHFEDTRKLLDVLNKLVDQGNTVVVIEHNLDVIRCADHRDRPRARGRRRRWSGGRLRDRRKRSPPSRRRRPVNSSRPLLSRSFGVTVVQSRHRLTRRDLWSSTATIDMIWRRLRLRALKSRQRPDHATGYIEQSR